MPIPPASPASTLQHDVGGQHRGLAADQGEDERHGHPDELRPEHDPEQRRPSGQEPAAEVAAAPRDRRQEAEDDRAVGRTRARSGGRPVAVAARAVVGPAPPAIR